MFLAADIGGTKTLIALGDQSGIRFQQHILNDDFAGPMALIAEFLRAAQAAGWPAEAERTCLALAGPVSPGATNARLTNRDWLIDADELSRTLALGPVRLQNDFVASTAGIATLTPAEVVALQTGQVDPAAPQLVIGPGTGLGVAAWLPGVTDAEGTGSILASEAGHVAFAPADQEQRDFLEFLAKRHGRVTVERIVSGAGLVECRDFCNREAGDRTTISPAEITRRAQADGDPACARALDLFLAIFGAFAGDMALSFLSRGGVFLVGGITPKILPRLSAGPFLAAFNDKAEHAGIAAAMPIVAVLAEDLALRGALLGALATARTSG